MSTSAEPYIYADNAATTPLSPAALDAMMPYLTNAFGNPSGIHRVAREAAEALADARARIAGLLDASSPDEIYFTSGGSESDTWILQGATRKFRDSYGAEAPVRIVTSAIEHHAVLHTCEGLAARVARIGALRDAFTDGVLASCENVLPTGPRGGARRLPSIASFICRDVDSELLVMLLDRAGVAAAAGSACSTGSTAPSHVISALGVSDPAWAHGSVRFSLADDVTEADIELLLERVPACIRRARAISCMR